MDIVTLMESIIAQYKQIEVDNPDSLNILKERIIAQCIKGLEPAKTFEPIYARDYINKAIVNLKGMKASKFLQMYFDFFLNLVPLCLEESNLPFVLKDNR